VAVFLLAAVCIVATVGCAGTTVSSDGSGSPGLIQREIEDIDSDILNTEEIYKASLTALQMDDDIELRREVNRLWIELEHLRSRKTALQQRLAELAAEEKK
jgi:hypothetical protein